VEVQAIRRADLLAQERPERSAVHAAHDLTDQVAVEERRLPWAVPGSTPAVAPRGARRDGPSRRTCPMPAVDDVARLVGEHGASWRGRSSPASRSGWGIRSGDPRARALSSPRTACTRNRS
jgi:hypothetical protein